MRRDVTELKKLVNEIMAERGATVSPNVDDKASFYMPPQAMVASAGPNMPTIIRRPVKPAHAMDDDIQDTEEYVEESLSLDDVEKEIIRKALEKHHGKRKSAAQELNISERTLYRKIKEYGLD